MIYRLFILLALVAMNAMATEEPKFDLLEKSANFELRQYRPVIIAEVSVEGDLDQASNKGFRLIADYIFGNNRARSGEAEKIAMIAPVTVEAKSEKIAMTAPVTVEERGGQWRVHFVMPSEYTLATLPVPNNPQVMLREIAARRVAVESFSGLARTASIAANTEALLQWMAGRQLKPLGNPELARYNPPWTLPFLRRNEIMVQYEKPDAGGKNLPQIHETP
ncbi:MAG: heme-binding protein [Proteobacteria bacterium]|nr:heme-binding protein [Pseudomonadota bacterium]